MAKSKKAGPVPTISVTRDTSRKGTARCQRRNVAKGREAGAYVAVTTYKPSE